ncbi:MAG TPA: alpha/beta hydrolase [Bacteroidia bacterium]|nr:alpha/beta hydrolase [Bacteroidia bacterium]HRG52045.1 alpha/beta hydrolase [Bacteroidia bacterium]
MPYIKTKGENAIQLFYQDLGKGKPVVFIHGWPSSHAMWEYQLGELPKKYRCIAYDRRGFGNSDKPWNGYDYDTFADDLNAVIETLNLSDVTLVGFSMGGGEVVRYLSKYGSTKVNKIVLVAAVTPFLLQTADNKDGAPQKVFDEMIQGVEKDRQAYLTGFGKTFFGVTPTQSPLSEEQLQWAHYLTLPATQRSTIECIRAFSSTDFREDCISINVPTLIIHGDQDKIVPFEISGKKAATLIKKSKLKVYEGAPHGLFITDKDKLNEDLIEFIGAETKVGALS